MRKTVAIALLLTALLGAAGCTLPPAVETLLPVFESKYGYIVEICTGDADTVADWAGVKYADAALLSESGSKKLSRRSFSNVTAWAVTRYALTPWAPAQPETGG